MRIPVVVVMCAAVTLGVVAAAYAQSTRRPDLNLFGRGLRDPQQSIVVIGNLGATFYDRITPVAPADEQVVSPDSGWGSFASAAVVYNLRLANVTFDGTVGGFASYYPDQARPFRAKVFPGAGARTGWSWALSEKTQVNVDLALGLRPAYAQAIFPGSVTGAGGFLGRPADNQFARGSDPNAAFLPREAAFVEGAYLTLAQGASLRHTLSRRWSWSARYDYQRNKAFDVDPEYQWRSAWRQSAFTALHFAATRHLSIRGGYRYEESYFPSAEEPYRVHGPELGVDYDRGLVLQLARRTSLAITGGASGYVGRDGRQRYRLAGDVELAHHFQRTWTTGARYWRGVSSSEIIFNEPVLTDRVSVFLNGLLTRRLGAHAHAVVQSDARAFTGTGRRSMRGAASAGLQTALGRHFALSADYTYYHYRFENAIARPSGLPAQSASQGVYIYLSTWASVFQRGGRTNAAR